MVRAEGEKLIVAPELTWICALAGANPLAVAVMMAEPAPAPVTTGARLTAVPPCGIKTFCGATVAFEGSLLVRVIKTPLLGEAAAKLTGNGAVCPGATVTLAGKIIWATPLGASRALTTTRSADDKKQCLNFICFTLVLVVTSANPRKSRRVDCECVPQPMNQSPSKVLRALGFNG